MSTSRIFARKNAVKILSAEEVKAVSGGWDFTADTLAGNYNTNPTRCAGPQGNPGDWAAGIVYMIEDDCGRDNY